MVENRLNMDINFPRYGKLTLTPMLLSYCYLLAQHGLTLHSCIFHSVENRFSNAKFSISWKLFCVAIGLSISAYRMVGFFPKQFQWQFSISWKIRSHYILIIHSIFHMVENRLNMDLNFPRFGKLTLTPMLLIYHYLLAQHGLTLHSCIFHSVEIGLAMLSFPYRGN